MLQHLRHICTAAILVGLAFPARATDPPPGFYDGVTGTGSQLKSQLFDRMRAGHIQRRYGDFRYSAPLHDADPNRSGRVLLAYSRASVSSIWNGSTWHREHVWPQSRQPGSASNSSRGNLGDPHALRPINPSINSSRSNKPFGGAGSSGSFGHRGSYYFPGNADRGDVARALFYSDTRYGPELGLRLVTGLPTGANQMGDLDALVAWHYADVPDQFERHRNHVIYSQSENPNYHTNNRNAFIDRPELVWSVYRNQANDSQLSLADATVDVDGASRLDLSLGRAMVGAAAPGSRTVTLNKTGEAGAYYAISREGHAISSRDGRYNAFQTGGSMSASFEVGLAIDTATSARYEGTVFIDNLDVTLQGGRGLGARDADDVISLSYEVLNHGNASFSLQEDRDDLLLDFGTVQQGEAVETLGFDLFNLTDGPLTAAIDITGFSAEGDDAVFMTDLEPMAGLEAGEGVAFSARIDTATRGTFESLYRITTHDAPLPGARPGSDSVLRLTGVVIPEPESLLLLGCGGLLLATRRRHGFAFT